MPPFNVVPTTPGNDDIYSLPAGDDSVDGGWGNDNIFTGAGNDLLIGGAGNDTLDGGDGNDTLLGGAGSDDLVGGTGDDLLNPGDNIHWDDIETGAGNDTVVFSDLLFGWVNLTHYTLTEGIIVTINGATNTGTVDKGTSGTTTLVDVANPMGAAYWGFGGGLWVGDTFTDDTFTITAGADQYIQISSNDGQDSFNIGAGEGTVVLTFDSNFDFYYSDPTVRVDADFGAGIISNDGFGNTETIIGAENVDHFRIYSGGSDSIIGTTSDDVFRAYYGGIDTIDGGAGFDRLDYTHYTASYTTHNGIRADLEVGHIYVGPNIEQYVLNIERVDGSKYLRDRILGDADANHLLGHGGDDTLAGRGGDDTLEGGDGTDTAVFTIASTQITVHAEGDHARIVSTLGNDLVHNDIETFIFSDAILSFDDLMARATPPATPGADTLLGSELADRLDGLAGNDLINGNNGNDTLDGGDGADTIIGGDGDDVITGGTSTEDLRDVIYAGAGNDSVDGGYGNDSLVGDVGNDTMAGSFGADTVIGNQGDDVLTGSAYSDQIFGNDGNDFINGGFGYDRVNGGADADRFYHLGVASHGFDWVQDYAATEGDVLFYGGGAGAATADDFLVQFAETTGAGQTGVKEAFVTHIPSGNVLWALIDGEAQAQINIQISGAVTDLLA